MRPAKFTNIPSYAIRSRSGVDFIVICRIYRLFYCFKIIANKYREAAGLSDINMIEKNGRREMERFNDTDCTSRLMMFHLQ